MATMLEKLGFQQLIEDARAMQAGAFAEHLQESVVRTPVSASTAAKEQLEAEDSAAFEPSDFGNISFDFSDADEPAAAGVGCHRLPARSLAMTRRAVRRRPRHTVGG